MPLLLQPVEDIAVGGWTSPSGGVVDLWREVDESVPDAGDFAISSLSPAGDYIEWKLAAVAVPALQTGHFVRYNLRADVAGGQALTALVELRQGAVVIASWTEFAVPFSGISRQRLLTAEQAGSIVATGGLYSNLRIRITATQA